MPPQRPALILAIVSTLLLAGCASPGADEGSGELASTLNMAPGTSATAPLVFDGVEEAPENLQATVTDADGLDVREVTGLLAGENDTVTGWLPVTVPADAEAGEHQVVVSLSTPDGEQRRHVTVTVSEPEATLSEGQFAIVHITARTPDGRLALTTDANMSDEPFRTTASFQPPQQGGPTQIPLQAQAQLPEGLLDGLVGTGIGHDVSVEVVEAFGAETVDQPQPREETIERQIQQQHISELPRDQAEAQGFVDESSQEGDPVEVPGTSLPYVVDAINETQVDVRLDVEENETYTLFEAWPDAAEVEEIANNTVTFFLTPDQEPGETFTWREEWPQATEIVEMTEAVIVLRHSPEVGTTYQQPGPQGQPTELTVTELTDEEIIVSQDNPHPLAGLTLTFDMHVVDQQQPPQQQPGMGGQPAPGGR